MIFLHLVAFNAMHFVGSVQGEWYAIQLLGATSTCEAVGMVGLADSLQDALCDLLVARHTVL